MTDKGHAAVIFTTFTRGLSFHCSRYLTYSRYILALFFIHLKLALLTQMKIWRLLIKKYM